MHVFFCEIRARTISMEPFLSQTAGSYVDSNVESTHENKCSLAETTQENVYINISLAGLEMIKIQSIEAPSLLTLAYALFCWYTKFIMAACSKTNFTLCVLKLPRLLEFHCAASREFPAELFHSYIDFYVHSDKSDAAKSFSLAWP